MMQNSSQLSIERPQNQLDSQEDEEGNDYTD